MRTLIISFLLLSSITIVSAQQGNDIYCAHARTASASESRSAKSVNRNAAVDNYDVKFYFLDLEADNLSTTVKGNVSITAKVVSDPLSQFVVELIDELQVDSVFINDVKLDFTHTLDEITVTLDSPLPVDDLFEATIFYQGTPPSGGFFSGISSAESTTWQNRVTWTLSEPLHANDWFPCKQVLEDKADSANIFITVPDHLKAGSNGILTNTVSLPNNRLRFEWKTKYPIAYYLISMTIAQYIDYSYYAQPEGSDPILVQNFIYDNPATLPNFKDAIDEVGAMIELFSEKFGLYPFHEEKYGHCMAPFSGGMEHQTMTSLGFFNFTLDAHELGHQWFGDNVTCGTWQDIWVNEGFARYSEYIALQNLRSQLDANSWLSGIHTSVLSLPDGSIYVPVVSAEDENRIFNTRLTYNKGASVIHMIRNIIHDDEVFFDLLKSYQNEFARNVATGEDFKELLEFKSGMEFDEFFEDWYYGEGYPIYEIEWNHFNDSLFVKQKQLTSHASVNLFEVPLEYRLVFSVGDSIVRFTPTQNEETFQIYMPTVVNSVSLDPNNWLLKKVNKFTRNTKLTGNTVVTGTDPEEVNLVSVYPNPAARNVTVSRKGNEAFNVSLTDINGRVVIRKNNNYNDTNLDLTGLGQGFYILQIAVNGKLQAFKLKVE